MTLLAGRLPAAGRPPATRVTLPGSRPRPVRPRPRSLPNRCTVATKSGRRRTRFRFGKIAKRRWARAFFISPRPRRSPVLTSLPHHVVGGGFLGRLAAWFYDCTPRPGGQTLRARKWGKYPTYPSDSFSPPDSPNRLKPSPRYKRYYTPARARLITKVDIESSSGPDQPPRCPGISVCPPLTG